jgi:hypothetical protein
LNPTKIIIGFSKRKMVEFIVSKNGIITYFEKIKFKDFLPYNKESPLRFLGMVG